MPTGLEGFEKKRMEIMIPLINGIFDVLDCVDNTPDSHMEIAFSIPLIGISARATLSSMGLRDLIYYATLTNDSVQEIKNYNS